LTGIEEATGTINPLRQKTTQSYRKNLQREDRRLCLEIVSSYKGKEMIYLIILFCFLMTTLGVSKCLVNEKTKRFKYISSGLTVCSGITGFLMLYGMLPSPANPKVNDLNYYTYGIPSDYRFCCEFYTRNEGEKSCELEKIEFIRSDTEFTFAKSAILTYGPNPNSTTRGITNSSLPASLATTNQLICFIGQGKCSTAKGGDFDAAQIEVKLYFRSKNKVFIIRRNVPVITACSIQNMR